VLPLLPEGLSAMKPCRYCHEGVLGFYRERRGAELQVVRCLECDGTGYELERIPLDPGGDPPHPHPETMPAGDPREPLDCPPKEPA
jgi:hypothetical protein